MKKILGVYAHPDDESAGSGGTFAKYAAEGVQVHVITATRGELGALGTRGYSVTREELPSVREAELRSALRMLGTEPPILLGYRDQELQEADFDEVVGKISSVMSNVQPDVVVTFGPTGITRHSDHVTVHKATLEAFHRHLASSGHAKLYYFAIPKEIAEEFDLKAEGPEVSPTVQIDVSGYVELKLKVLRGYRSQEDIQELADMMEKRPWSSEWFHQVYPAAQGNELATSLLD